MSTPATITKKRDIYLNSKVSENLEDRNEFIGFMFFFYLIPVALMYFEIFPFGSHNVIIPLMGLLILAYTIEKGMSFSDLGLLRSHKLRGLGTTISVTAVLFTLLVIGSRLGLIPESLKGEKTTVWFMLYYVLISAPIQEFIFRAVMHHEFELIAGKHGRQRLRIVLSALVFALAHSFFHSWSILLGTFVLGLIWSSLYLKYKNLWPIALSHGLLGISAMLLGIL